MSELLFDSELDQRLWDSSLRVIGGSPSDGFEEAFRFVHPDCEGSESLREQLSLRFEVAISMPGLTDIEKCCLAIKAIKINNQISKICDDSTKVDDHDDSAKVDDHDDSTKVDDHNDSTKVDDHNDILGQIIILTNADLENLLRVTAACLDSVCLLPISKEDSDEIVNEASNENSHKIQKFKDIIFKKDESNRGFVFAVFDFLKYQQECGYNIVKNDAVVDLLVISIGMEPNLFDAVARQQSLNSRFGVVTGR